MVFGNGVKSIQAAAYNGAPTVSENISATTVAPIAPSVMSLAYYLEPILKALFATSIVHI